MGNNARLDGIREDLKVQITDVFPSPGTILVVYPKNNVQFHPDYARWLAATLQEILPLGVKAMIVSENVSNFSLIFPESDNYNYVQGWNDAIRKIAELNPL